MNEEIIQNLNERLDRTIEKSKTFLEDEKIRQQLNQAKLKAESTVREHPVTSILAGVAVGYLIARMLRSDD